MENNTGIEVHTFDGMPHGAIYNACQQKQREWMQSMCDLKKEKYPRISWKEFNRDHATFPECIQWQHLSDAVEKGTISPGEAYDALKLGWVPEVLKLRESRYSHLI